MSNKQLRLSNWQVLVLVASNIIGVVVLALPRLVVQKAGVDGVITTFLGGIIAIVLLLVIAKLSLRFPEQSVMEYSTQIIGKILGKAYGSFIVIYTILVSSVILRAFSDAIKLVLQRTPIEIIMISMLFVTLYLIQNGINSVAKICEAFFPLIVLSLLILILLNYQNLNMDNFRPMLSKGLLPIFRALPDISLAYLGFEVVFFIVPFLNEPQKIIPFSVLGIAFPIALYTALVAVCIGVFGTTATSGLMYPTVALARSIAFPGAFAERFDLFFVILWVLAAYTSIAIYYYLSGFSLSRLVGLRNFRPFFYIILPFVYLIAILPQNIFHINLLSKWTGILGMAIASSSVLLLLLSFLRKKGEEKNA